MTTLVTTNVVDGNVMDAAIVNNNYSAIQAVINGKLDNANLAASPALAVSRIDGGTEGYFLKVVSGVATWAQASVASAIEVGTIFAYGGTTAPTGYLLCDGTSYATANQPALHAVIGYAYGGSGANFNVPDMRGRTIYGKGTHVDVDALGDNEGVALASRTPKLAHNHPASGTRDTNQAGSLMEKFVGNTTITPPYGVARFIIKA